MNKFLKVAVATATVFAVQDACSATVVNSCSKSGFYISGAIKGKRQCASFTLNENLKPVTAEKAKKIIVELLLKESQKFEDAQADENTNNTNDPFDVNVNTAGTFGMLITNAADSNIMKNFPALGTVLSTAGTKNPAVANQAGASNAKTLFDNANAHLVFENNTNNLHVMAINQPADKFVEIVANGLNDSATFAKWESLGKANSEKTYADAPTAKCEYSAGKKWSFGGEISAGWEQRFGDVVLNIGGVFDFMFARNKVSCEDTGIASAKDNSNNNNGNKYEKSKETTNDYGVDVSQKPSFGGEIGVAYNCTRKFSIGAGADVWYKRYEVSTNKMADLFILKEDTFYGNKIKSSGGNLDTLNKDALATGIAEKSVKANGWVISPYIKLRYDFNQHCGMFIKVGYDINKTVLKADSSFGTLKVGGFHTSLGFVAVV